MAAQYQIIQANLSDIPVIQQIAQAAWLQVYPAIISHEQIDFMLEQMYSKSSLTEQMEKQNHQFVLLKQENATLGFVSFSPAPKQPSRMRMQKLYLLPECKGKGFGKQLVNFVCERALKEGLSCVELNVNRLNPAVKFYKHLGFEIESEVDLPIGPYWMNDYVMVKRIESLPQV